MKQLPADILYKIYKAKPGGIIDNTYVLLSGGLFLGPNIKGFDTDDADENGVFRYQPVYQFTFKDLSDGLYYNAFQACSYQPGYGSDPQNGAYFKEPFSDRESTPYPVFVCDIYELSVNTHMLIDQISP
ncbi:TPA: hypothetical protein ACKP1B_001758 [Serratia fonticola]